MSGRPPLPAELGPLNPAQEAAVTHLDGPLLILAGAGSGKTRVLTRRIAYLLHAGADPEHLFAVTFTNKAAAEMKERVAELVGEKARKVWVSTFHSSCCRILRMEAEALGYTNRFAIYDDDDQLRILRQVVADLGYDPKIVPPKAILGRIDHHKNRMEDLETLIREHRMRGHDPLVRAWRDYEEALRASDALDFNDLIGKTVELFETRPDILAKYRERFRYVMVDEYQDTNHAQYRLLRMLAEEHRNLAVVGDDDQSIYGFRGADIRNILDFQEHFPDAKVVRMEQNYRCNEHILAVANAVVAQAADRIDKKLWTEQQGGPKVTFLLHDDVREEARTVTMAILGLRRKGVAWRDIAVIYRTNATSQPFEATFREMGIPFQVVGGRQFYARREIRDALAYVRLIVNPADDAALLRVINVPARGIGPATLTLLREEAANRGEPLLRAARAMAAGQDRPSQAVAGFVRLVDELADTAAHASLVALVQAVLERSGYVDMLVAEDSREARGRIENLEQLLQDAAAYEGDDALGPIETVHGWLDRIALTGADEALPEDGQVTLMTVHCSKGLEYPVVFVVQMVEGSFPHARSLDDGKGVDEERRLAYVAFTRAKERLYVSRSRNRLAFDREARKRVAEPAAPSRFLFGIPRTACEGMLPATGEETGGIRPTTTPRSGPSPIPTAALHRFLEEQRQRAEPTPAPEPPPGEYTTLQVESAEQLRPGVTVLDSRYGLGEVVRRSAHSVLVRFPDRDRRVAYHEGRLQLVRD